MERGVAITACICYANIFARTGQPASQRERAAEGEMCYSDAVARSTGPEGVMQMRRHAHQKRKKERERGREGEK